MKLYKVPQGSKIRVVSDVVVPPIAPEINAGDILEFSHIDGMYSLCYDKDNNPVNLVAWAEVDIITPEEIVT